MANLLRNPGFNEGPAGRATFLEGAFVGGDSAAPEWSVWNNDKGPNDVPLTTTDVLPSTRPDSRAGSMIHVDTLGPHNGIRQVFGTIGEGPERTEAMAWVYVLRGRVGIGTGNGGHLSDSDGESTTIGQWEQIRAPRNGVSPANEFVIYATSVYGASFYVDEASVAVAEPRCEAILANADLHVATFSNGSGVA